MARRGARPKAAHLRLVDGTHRTARHGNAAEAREKVQQVRGAFGPMTKPKGLKNRAGKAWDSYIMPAFWLDRPREPAAIAFCELWSEFTGSPSSFPASKHGQMRAYMSELGLTDDRNRAAPKEGGQIDEFFG